MVQGRLVCPVLLSLIIACHGYGPPTPENCHRKYEVRSRQPAKYAACMDRWAERQDRRAERLTRYYEPPRPTPAPAAPAPAPQVTLRVGDIATPYGGPLVCAPADGGLFCLPANRAPAAAAHDADASLGDSVAP